MTLAWYMRCRPEGAVQRQRVRHSPKGPMDCTICGKTSLPGAMLCAPCKAALKRARYVTVQDDMRPPSVIDVRRQRRRARAPVARTEAAPPAQLPAARERQSKLVRRVVIGVVLLVVALGGASYFTQRDLGARSRAESGVAPAIAPEVRHEVAASGAAPGNADAKGVPSAVEQSKNVTIGAEVAPVTPPSTKLGATAAVKRTMPANRATFATANGDPPDAVAPPPEPLVIAAAPPPTPARPIPDRWQNMREALAQCDREGVFGGLVCGQRVRIQYCEGYWGKVAQCQGAAATYER